MIHLPLQLARTQFRFIKVDGKIPKEQRWQDLGGNNYTYRDRAFLYWLAAGNNYGVMAGPGNLIIIDADRKELADIVEANLPETFTVETSVKNKETGWRGKHFYYISEGVENHPVEMDIDGVNTHIGDLQACRKQVVGPGSKHPSGLNYSVGKNLPIAMVPGETITQLLTPYFKALQPKNKKPKFDVWKTGNKMEVKIDISKIIDLSKMTLSGGEAVGPHPIHGSDNGQNFGVNLETNQWFCFRHWVGGGPLQLIALMEGLVSCEDLVETGCLSTEVFKEVIKIAKEKYDAEIISDDELSKPKFDVWR